MIILLAFALLTTSRGTVAQAEGAHSNLTHNTLSVYGKFNSGKINQPYRAVLTVIGGRYPYYFSVKNGALPPGIHLDSATGEISGTPTTAGNYTFEVIVTDSPLLDEGGQTVALAIGDGSGGGGGNVTVSVSPPSATLSSGEKQTFTATISGTPNTGAAWSATVGSVSGVGVYTAPTVSASTNVVVTATSTADPTKSASTAITVNPVASPTLQITTSALPQGELGQAYGAGFTATGGAAPYTWSISGGTPPAGIAINTGGDLAGIPTTVGTFNFSVKTTDANNQTASSNFSVNVAAGGHFDGPAELPRVTVPSAMSDTPAPGAVIPVRAGDNLQSALNSARCGDTIELQAGATFAGFFRVPAKGCDNNHWVIIRTSAPDSALPAEGQRATPCYAGVASLPGRPQYSCPNPQNVMAKIEMNAPNNGPLEIESGANYYRFLGLEVTRVSGIHGSARLVEGRGTADHLVFDRSWLHGALQDETDEGVDVNGMTNVAVVDSYFSDFHCISVKGTCTDAHAISGGNSTTQDGPYKIQDNFLESTGEAILFGGGPATTSPADIEILGNHFWKPWQWMPGNPNFIGGPDGRPFIVKNHLELKNAVRVLIEANLMENNWGGFSQTGYALLLTPRNQPTHQGNGPYVCPLCQVTDVTIRYVHISHTAGGIMMATVEDIPGEGKLGEPALAGTRFSIHDVVLDDLSSKYNGGGVVFEIMNGWSKNPLNTITINHVTGFPDPHSHMMVVGSRAGAPPMYGLVFTNNMITTGRYPVWAAIGGASCAQTDVPITSISNCFTTNIFSNNALVASPSAFPPSSWPADNMFPQTVNDVQFVNFNNGNGGNYQLQSHSPYLKGSSDGKNVGADIAGLAAALTNVE